jgi:predicted nucleic-acid-binding protein
VRAIDTNVLVRALVDDTPEQTARARVLLKEHPVYIPVTVALELEWVLRSRYGFPAKRMAETLENLAALENAVLGERTAVLAAAAKLAQGWDFADALHHALSHGCEDFVTLDEALAKRSKRIASLDPSVTRL